VLLGGSNLIYWSLAVEHGIVGPEIVITAIHGLLVFAHLMSFFLACSMPVSAASKFERE